MTSIPLTAKDFKSDQEVRWCPGCGDYAILNAVQGFMPELGIPKEKIVFVSGIGCAARFPYYMETYGMHSIHGRAPAIATGLATARTDLSVWVIGGDGDMLSIGGNHLIHALRRNVNLTILLFNNQIYGLTKGQYSPTSERGKVTKSTPFGSVDQPFNPLSVAIGAEATFVARAIDTDKKELSRGAARGRGAPRRLVRRGLPELQHLQRRRLRLRPRAQGEPHLPASRRADRVRRPRRAARRRRIGGGRRRVGGRAARARPVARRAECRVRALAAHVRRRSAQRRSVSSARSSARPTTRRSPSRSAARRSSEARATSRRLLHAGDTWADRLRSCPSLRSS